MELSMWIIALIILLAAFFFIVHQPGQLHPPSIHGHGRVEFYSKGMDAGFSLSEINLLWHASRRAELQNPPMISVRLRNWIKPSTRLREQKSFPTVKAAIRKLICSKNSSDYRKKSNEPTEI
jgi:hypothetical protein